MTTNLLVAIGFPLLTAAVVSLTGLLVRRPFAETVDVEARDAEGVYDLEELSEALSRAGDLIRQVEQKLRSARPKSPKANLDPL